MNAPVTAQATEIQRIEAAMDALLTACTAHQWPNLSPYMGLQSAGKLANDYLGSLSWSPVRRAADELLSDPVGRALRHGIRQLAEYLFEIGGMQALHDACERVADMDPANWNRRTSIMDSRFDGIGREGGKAGWCS